MDDIPDLLPIATWVLVGFSVLIAIGVAGAVAGAWTTLLLWVNRVPFSQVGTVTDPVFGRDISFFLFDLPFLRTIQSVVNGLLLASLAVSGAYYLLQATKGGEVFITRVRVHLAVLGGLYLLSVAFGYQLDKYELVYSTAGVATGVSYTDANARFLAYDVLTLLSGLAAALLVGGAFTRWLWPLGMIVIVWVSASLVLGRIYPEAVQRFTVDPNQYAQEEPYIGNNISMTRLAFNLDKWSNRDYNGTAPLTSAALTVEAPTLANARLWDYRPLQVTLDQLQVVRQYYDFHDVDTDRYMVDGRLRQVMLSGRELAIEKNPSATGWVNTRIIYTHGIGMAMVPVNEVTREGQPQLWIRDLPPTSQPGVPTITQPRIYFGETDNHYVVVRARQAEFDYPRTAGNTTVDETTRWSGTTGIPLDTTLSRLLFALRFKDLDLLITDQIKADSQLLFRRTISDRLQAVAPFLRYDKDPYLVIDDTGRLVWIQDAYTVTDAFPNANAFSGASLGGTSGLAGDTFDYIRNSVKITIDAYDGTMHFYVADPNDPLIRAWEGVFPKLFEPMSSIPAGIVPHLRYPEELFNVQTRMYGRYHVTQALTFFNNTDRWTIPDPQTNEQSLPSEAYYVVMRMPEETGVEFLLLQPMIAASRPNMIAWVAARSDSPNYGQVFTLSIPRRYDDLRARADRGEDRSGSHDQRPDIPVEPERVAGPARQPDRDPGRPVAALPAAGLSPVHLGRIPRVPEDRRRQPHDPGLGRHAHRCPDSAHGQAGRPCAGRRPGWQPGSNPDTGCRRHARARHDARADGHPRPDGSHRPADGRQRPRGLRQRPLRRGAGFAAHRRLRDVRRRDGQGRVRPQAPRGTDSVAGTQQPAVTAAPPAPGAAPVDGWARLPWWSAMTGAVLVTLMRPLTWALGLAGFLAGGGLFVVAGPILVLPTPTGLQNALGGPVSTLVFGSLTPGLVARIVSGVAGALLVAVAAVVIGAWAERQGIGVVVEAATADGIVPPASLEGAPGVGRVALVRLMGLAPVAIAIAIAWQPVYDAAYRELVLPDDLVTPLPLRVISDVPQLLALIGVTWLLSDAAASVGVRRLVLERRSVLAAWAAGWGHLARRPLRVIATALLGALVVVVLVGPALAAAAVAWARVREILEGGADPLETVAAVGAWVAIWFGCLLLAGVGAGIRAAAWSLEVPRRLPQPGPSPGCSADRPPRGPG